MSEVFFHKANDVQEVLNYLTKYGSDVTLIAGGTDLMPRINMKKTEPKVLIYIGECGLDFIKEEDGCVIIGAAVTFNKIIKSALIKEKIPLLNEVSKKIASTAIRNMGTIGGNLANASPAADSAVALLALGARLKLVNARSERIVSVSEFFEGPGKTIIQENEVLAEIIIPITKDLQWSYYKLGRRQASTLSVISAAVTMEVMPDKCRNVRVALGAVAPTPLLAVGASAVLEGMKPDEKLIEQAAEKAVEEIAPIDDIRGTAWYRKQTVKAVVKRLLQQIIDGKEER